MGKSWTKLIVLYYNILTRWTPTPMPHHHSGHVHPSASVTASLLRLSALQRLGVTTILLALLWGAVAWVLV